MPSGSPGKLPTLPGQSAELRRLLHDANDELSVAALQLELLTEAGGGDLADSRALGEALEACHRAAQVVRRAWRLLEDREDPAGNPG